MTLGPLLPFVDLHAKACPPSPPLTLTRSIPFVTLGSAARCLPARPLRLSSLLTHHFDANLRSDSLASMAFRSFVLSALVAFVSAFRFSLYAGPPTLY